MSVELLCGDCLVFMKQIESNSVDMILADPPYGTTACKWDSVIDLGLMWEQLNRIIKPNCPIVLTAQTPFSQILGASNIRNLKYEWIWEKTAATGHLNAKKQPMKAHENILVFYSGQCAYYPQMTEGHKPTNIYTKRSGDGDCYGKTVQVSGGGSTTRYPRSTQIFKSDKQKISLHPTQKPVALMEFLIKTYTIEGQTVLDFTMGSGTTGVACKNLNRNFIGIELDHNYFKIAEKRISETCLGGNNGK